MATIKDIAQKLGVSVSTVSKGLNGAKDISEDLRQQVLATAIELGYKKKSTYNKETRKLVIFIENMDYETNGDFGHEIVSGFEESALKDDWAVDIYSVDHNFQVSHPYDSLLMENGYSGSLVLGFSNDDPWMSDFAETNFPTVLLDNFIPVNPHVACIGTDSFEGIDMAVDYLVRLGHEKIAFLNGSKGSHISDERMEAYLKSMSGHHLSINPGLAVYSYFVREAARYHVPGLLSQGVTAILCGNDLIAAGVIDSIRDRGYKVPEDISVVGFDDIPLAAAFEPPITTIRQDCSKLGKSGFFALQSMMEQVAVSKNLLRPSLVIRSSVGVAKPRIISTHNEDRDSLLYANPLLYETYLKKNLMESQSSE